MPRSWSIRISLLAVLLFMLGLLLSTLGLLPGLYGFFLYGLAVPVGLVGVVVGIIAAVQGRARHGLTAVGLGLAVIVGVIAPGVMAGDRPRINDMSTDLEDVPAFIQAKALPENQGRDMGYPAEFKPIVRDSYKNLKPLRVSAPPDAVFEQALALAREQPRWKVTTVDPQARTFEGVVESRLFRFRDDFIVRVRADGEGTRVDMRSKSRVGKGDLGANAQRIEQFLQALVSRAGSGAANAGEGR
ncbi:DUF1499 domain-containing protein [Hyalangium sp.]|uniref:DUF1499 domain-containing protein n=1 Tax=Hyalangium sp. TaxID=2028555 RepID=UPI002D546FDF|nr:DUF1499 domain-containing protein [Hyalangium sp.]HYH99043.1 DUF1499 domain-containing protein [Hyalangium sp.]